MPVPAWIEKSFGVYRNPAALRMFFLGFSSGLPLLLVLGTLSFWMREVGVDLKTIGFMSWVGLCWGFKWLWAPLVDRLPIPFLTRLMGRRRSWLLVSQIGIAASLLAMAVNNPAENMYVTAALAVCTAFFGATQDVALDAYRIESGSESEQGAFAATYQTGYRLAMIWSGAGALAIAAAFEGSALGSWRVAYSVMAVSMLVGIATVILGPEPAAERPRTEIEFTPAGLWAWFHEAACKPFIDFFSRFGRFAIVVLLLIGTYRISDVVMGIMANPFYQDLGFTKQEVAGVSKVFGVIMTLVGAFAGGAVMARIGVMKTLMLGGILSAATNLLFAMLAQTGNSLPFLIVTVSADNLAGGLASAAFIAYLSGLVNTAYSATQYALFSSVMLVGPKFLAGFSGMVVESVGYSAFFTGTAVLGLPVLALVWACARQRELQESK